MLGLIASTTTKTGLVVRCELDHRIYPKGIKVSDDLSIIDVPNRKAIKAVPVGRGPHSVRVDDDAAKRSAIRDVTRATDDLFKIVR